MTAGENYHLDTLVIVDIGVSVEEGYRLSDMGIVGAGFELPVTA